MAIGRKKALQRLENLAPLVEDHLLKIVDDPTAESAGHWRIEVENWLNQMAAVIRHVGKRTGDEWSQRIARWRTELENLNGNG